MKIIALPDLHGAGISHFSDIADALTAVDVILLPGDLTNGSVEDAKAIIEALRKFKASILAVPGNWDNPHIDDYLKEVGVNLHRRSVNLNQVIFAGVGGSLPFSGTPNDFGDPTFAIYLAEAASGLNSGDLHVLVCHQPPLNTLNDLPHIRGRHVGSKSVRDFIEHYQPLICFTGHVHEGKGIDTIGKTKIVNPGPIWQRHYAYAEIQNGEISALEICTF